MDDSTKKTIQDLINQMIRLASAGDGDRGQRPLMATIQFLVAIDQAKSAAKLERFTFWLIVLTIALVVVGGIQIALMICGHQ